MHTSSLDFFMSSGRYADVVLPGSFEEDEGTVTQTEGRVIKINKPSRCPGEARPDWRIIRTSPPWAASRDDLRESTCDVRRVAHRVQGGSRTTGITYERIEENFGVFGPCPSDVPEGVPMRPAKARPAVRSGVVEPRCEGRRAVSISRTARPA